MFSQPLTGASRYRVFGFLWATAPLRKSIRNSPSITTNDLTEAYVEFARSRNDAGHACDLRDLGRSERQASGSAADIENSIPSERPPNAIRRAGCSVYMMIPTECHLNKKATGGREEGHLLGSYFDGRTS